jgi:hypothetical protein
MTRNEKRMERRLQRLLDGRRGIDRIQTFEEAGILTRNRGLVIRLEDGTKYQITIVEDERGW